MPVTEASVSRSSAFEAASFVMEISAFSALTMAVATAAKPPASASDEASRLPMAFMDCFMLSGSWMPSLDVRPFTTSPRFPMLCPASSVAVVVSSICSVLFFSCPFSL